MPRARAWPASAPIAVVVSQNIVRSAAWLLFALAGVAGVFFQLNAQFVGATQLLVYVGGTLVLVVFGVMLTAQGPFIRMRINAAEWAIAGSVGLLLYTVLAVSLLSVDWGWAKPGPMASSENLGLAFLGPRRRCRAPCRATPSGYARVLLHRAGRLHHRRAAEEGEYALPRTPMSYLLPFEIVSVHLLVVLIAAAYLAHAERRRGGSSGVRATLNK